jgi:4-amino-4-deoxy-L-arabinose transferase-like glycosyltransferase
VSDSIPASRRTALPVAPSRVIPACAVVAVALLVTALAATPDLSHIDEHRYAEVSRVMAEPGGDWLVPHLNGVLYTDKPPLFFWAAAAAQRCGIPLPAAAIVPSLLGAAAALLATFGIARRLSGMQAALASAVVLACGVRFASLASRANLDALLTGFVAIAIYAVVRGDAAERRSASRAWYAAACLACGLGVLVKGPLAIAVPAVAIVGQRLLEGRGRSLLSPWLLAALALALAPIGLWLGAAVQQVGWDYASQLVVHHGYDHALGRVNHAGGLFDYVRIFPAAFLPGTLLLPAAFATLPRARRFAASVALPLAWFAGGFVLLSLFPVKRHHYLMPLYPGAALLAGRLFAADVEEVLDARPWARHLLTVARFAIAALGLATGVALIAAALLLEREIAVALSLACGAAAVLGAVAALKSPSQAGRAAGLAAAALAVTIAQARVVQPLLAEGTDKRAFLESVADVVGDGAVADYGGMHFAANWILRRDVVPVLADAESASRFLAAAAPGRRAFLLVERDELARKGMPSNASVVRVGPRPLDAEFVLLGSRD